MVLGYNTKAHSEGVRAQVLGRVLGHQEVSGSPDPARHGLGHAVLEFALLADGVTMDKLYPIDIERAFNSHVARPLGDPEVLGHRCAVVDDARRQRSRDGRDLEHAAQVAIDQGAPLDIQWNQNALLAQAYGIPVGSKNYANAVKFIDYASSPAVQARWLAKYKAIPVNTKAYGATSKELIDPRPETPWTRSKGFVLDINWWAENRPKVNDVWSKWIIR